MLTGDNSFNPQKRALEQSPPSTAQSQPPQPSQYPQQHQQQQQQPAAPPFQTSARTIYSGKLGSAFGSPAPSGNGSPAPPSLDGGGNETDGFSGGNMYYGQRTTGMGRTASGDSGMSQVTASHPQDQPRKRLRRGGPGGDDVSTSSSPSHCTSLGSPCFIVTDRRRRTWIFHCEPSKSTQRRSRRIRSFFCRFFSLWRQHWT